MFFKKKKEVKAEQRGNFQEVRVLVDGGYKPERIVLKEGLPARIIFDRQTDSACFDQVVFPDFNIKADLPVKEDFFVELTPKEKGEFGFACGMNMYHGTLVVK
ncbi:cupredoxin domain-containing protein [Streptococcus thoraltensis]|uniref:cupredoxin domain-containing protein n=1 Tax=Streptococcus thoraltensis TaxID=55085 RepID=UPI0003676D5D|nr:cupredoxin domain-containing protein [Streptococcus thoraltensis]MDY4761274.1 cupredoxin domain-containing protein [Streptococcus thoraltensis]